MSDKKVDLSQIRGDWDFHSRYVTNAMEQTLKRANKLWKELNKSSRKKGQVPVEGQLVEDFIEALYQAKGLTDDFYTLADCKPVASKAKKKTARKKATKKKSTKKKSTKKKTAKKKTTKKKTAKKRGSSK